MIPSAWWRGAALVPVVCAGLCVVATLRGTRLARLAAMQLCSTSIVLALLLVVEATGRPSYVIVPLALAGISVPGTLIIANVIQRWLREDACEA
jgi:multisubunit Na+/H+ antiporter MnhF subunit